MFSLIRPLFAKGPSYRWQKVFSIVFLSTLLIIGGFSLAIFLYKYIKHIQIVYAKAHIRGIIQTGPISTQLPTIYLAEVLDLSIDRPQQLALYSTSQAETSLLATNIIKQVGIKKIKPDFLFIDYTARVPFFISADYTNTVMDEEGFFFPYMPFNSPRNLPQLYLGKSDSYLSGCVDPYHLNIIKILVARLGIENIERIDLSHAEAPSSGQREIVIFLKECLILRMTAKSMESQLSHFISASKIFLKNVKKPAIIDLRLPDVAYLQCLENEIYTDLLILKKL